MKNSLIDSSLKNSEKNLENRIEIYKKNKIVDGEHKLIVPLAVLFELEDNPKAAEPEDMDRLDYQITKLGQYKPLIVKPDGTVLGGNHRLKKYIEKGYLWLWVSIVYPKDETDEMEYVLSDNDHIAKYLEEELVEKLRELKDLNIAAFKVNISPQVGIDTLLDKYADSPPEDDVPALGSVPTRVEYGQIYRLGRHKLLCGDATKPEAYTALMDGELADLVVTDPPYNIDYNNFASPEKAKLARRRTDMATLQNDHMTEESFKQFLTDSLKYMMEHSRGSFYIFMSPQQMHNLYPAFQEAGGHFSNYIIWVKNNFTISGSDWQNMHEPILYGWNKKHNHYFAGYRDEGNVWQNLETLKPRTDEQGYTIFKLGLFELKLKLPEGEKIEGEVCKKRDCVDIWEEKRPTRSAEHPTMKPVKVVAKAIRASSHRADIVLDPFGGSGTTIIAAERTGRRCNMMELDPKYADVILARYEKLTGETAELIGKVVM